MGTDEPGDIPEDPERSSAPDDATAVASSGLRGIWANPAYRFVALFLIYLGLVSVLYPLFTASFSGVIRWLIDATAYVEYLILRPFTSEVSYAGNLVVFQGFSVKIIVECTGIFEIMIFSAAVLAFPTSIPEEGHRPVSGRTAPLSVQRRSDRRADSGRPVLVLDFRLHAYLFLAGHAHPHDHLGVVAVDLQGRPR